MDAGFWGETNTTINQRVVNTFASKILTRLNDLFDEKKDDNISPESIQENASEFFHAIGNIVPAFYYSRLTDKEMCLLDFNHIANKLVLESYSEASMYDLDKLTTLKPIQP